MKPIFKRLLSGTLSATMAVSAIPIVSAHADESTEPYPYTMFAATSNEGAITVNAGNFCVNGNVATNGTIVSSGNMNINGTRTESTDESMIFIFDKIENQYFSASNVDKHDEDYTLDELNININVPTEVQGETNLTGNININNALKSLEDINLYGEVKNTNESLIFSKYGDIIIDSQNVNLNGLVYAPFGSVTINAQNLNLNNVVIIAESIELTCPNVNANNSSNASSFVGTTSEQLDIPYDEWQYMKDENENGCPDYFESYSNWIFLKDTDEDKLPDSIEQYIGSDPHNQDSDSDTLSDGYEALTTYTSPIKWDSYCSGISDGEYDIDDDGLTNYQEMMQGTDPYNRDTDIDGLIDGDEVFIHQTDPLNEDTDYDGIKDGDEIELGKDPAKPDISENETFTRVFTPDMFGISCDEGCVPEITLTAGAEEIKDFKMSIYQEKMVVNPFTPGYMGYAYDFSTSGEFDNATLKFTFDESIIEDEQFVPAIYYYNEDEGRLQEVDNQVISGNSVSASLEHFSVYTVLNKTAFDAKYNKSAEIFQYLPLSDDAYSTAKTDTDLVFVLDDSGSMDNNDPYNMRKKATASFVNNMPINDNYAIYSFTGSVSPKLLLPLTKADEAGKAKCDAALSKLSNDYTGTDGSWGLHSAIQVLKNSENVKCIIFLTDGEDTHFHYDYDEIIKSAQDKQITIFTIGLTHYSNGDLLDKIATQTGGKFFNISDISELSDCYQKIKDLTIDYITDSNGDGISDYDTWKMCTGQYNDGFGNTVFPFGNPLEGKLQKSKIDAATALFNSVQQDLEGDFDHDGLKNNEEVRVHRSSTDVKHTYVQIMSYPSKEDTDTDDYIDGDERNKFGSNPNEVSILLNENQLNHLANTDYIASAYKNQTINGDGAGFINGIGRLIGNKVYSYKDEDELYIRELIDILDAMENGIIEEMEYKKTRDALSNTFYLLEGIYTSELFAGTGKVVIDDYVEGWRNYQEFLKAKEALRASKSIDDLKDCYNAFINSNSYLNTWAKIRPDKWALKANFSTSVKNISGYAWMDYAVRAFTIADVGVETACTYSSLYCIGILFDDSIDILNEVKDNTDDERLINAVNTMLPYLYSGQTSLIDTISETVEAVGAQVAFNGTHIAISMAGPVGVAIEAALALGNINGISAASEAAVRTCCAASTADALATMLDTKVKSSHSSGIRFKFPVWSYEKENADYIYNHYNYLLYSRREANQKFRDLQEAPLIHGLQYDELIGLCNTNRTWLSDDYMNDGYLVIDCKKDIHSNG